MRSTTANPTWRAGTNFRDPTRSGYARVSVIENQDLFPNEGYEFPDQTMHKPPTNSYRISDDSPFNNSYKHSSAWREPQPSSIANCMSNMLRTEQICNRVAVKAISTPTDGELRPFYSKIAEEAIKKDRQAQVLMKEQMKLQQMKDDAYWAEVEQEQGLQTLRVQQQFTNSIRSQQKTLADDYKQQFALHKKREDEEKEEQRQEALKLKAIQREEEKRELARQAKIREENAQRAREFQLKNEELLKRREKRIEDDLAQEAITMRQHEESERRMEERAQFVKKKRDEKNRIRERLINEQSKKLAEIKAKQQRVQSVAESEIAKREEAERKKKLEEKKRLADQRNQDYQEYLRNKDLKNSEAVETPDFTNEDDEDAREFDRKMKALERKRVLRDQMAQAAERKERERRERLEEIMQSRKTDTMYFLKDNEW